MSYQLFSDEFFMNEALKEARKAYEKDEVPVGAVVVAENQVIARTHNMVESLQDVTAHAEILAITAAENFLGSKFLNACSLYVTLEPCCMCASAASHARVQELIYGATDPKAGYSLISDKILHPKTNVKSGILEYLSNDLLRSFFQKKRR